MALWNRRYQSRGGRLVLSNLPVYMFSIQLAPMKVVEETEKIMRLFL